MFDVKKDEYGILNFGLTQADKYYDGLMLHFQKIADSPLPGQGLQNRPGTWFTDDVICFDANVYP